MVCPCFCTNYADGMPPVNTKAAIARRLAVDKGKTSVNLVKLTFNPQIEQIGCRLRGKGQNHEPFSSFDGHMD